MKKVFQKAISLLLVFALMNLQGFASVNVLSSLGNDVEINEFASFNESEFMAEFDDLQAIEKLLEAEPLTLSELKSSDFALNVSINPNPVLPFEEEGMNNNGGCNGFTAFLMGFGCGIIGVLIVYFKTDDSKLTNQALFGCVAWSTVWIILQVNNAG